MSKPTKNKNIKIPDNILKDLLTLSEWRMLRNRYQILSLLEEGLSVRKIAARVKVGTDTVVRVTRMVKRAPKRDFIRTKTPWIFGRSDE